MSRYPFQYKRVAFHLNPRIKPFNTLLVFDKDIDLSNFNITTINLKNRGIAKRFLEETLIDVYIPSMDQRQFEKWFNERPLLSQVEYNLTSKDIVNILNFLNENQIKYELIYGPIKSAHIHTQHPLARFIKCLPNAQEKNCLSFISFENQNDLIATKLKCL